MPPFVKTVGLFVNQSPAFINKICLHAAIDVAQIHFEADETFYANLTVPHLKVVRAAKKSDIRLYESEYRLVDSFTENYGGVGKRLNLEWFDGEDTDKIIIAGGLNTQNVNEIAKLGFYGVDVSSGVESSPGKKDRLKMVEFIKQAKQKA